jgi:hypothetical protein
MTADEYRERWGIPAMEPLASAEYVEVARRRMLGLRAAGKIDNTHLPAATTAARAAPKPKIGSAKKRHAALIAELRPGDWCKIPDGGKRKDGRDAVKAREAQRRRRAARRQSRD